MTDERIEWTGSPSQWQNFWWFVAALLLIPIPWTIWKWLEVRSTVYTLTDQRLKFTRGVFSKVLGFADLQAPLGWMALSVPVILGLSILLLKKQER